MTQQTKKIFISYYVYYKDSKRSRIIRKTTQHDFIEFVPKEVKGKKAFKITKYGKTLYVYDVNGTYYLQVQDHRLTDFLPVLIDPAYDKDAREYLYYLPSNEGHELKNSSYVLSESKESGAKWLSEHVVLIDNQLYVPADRLIIDIGDISTLGMTFTTIDNDVYNGFRLDQYRQFKDYVDHLKDNLNYRITYKIEPESAKMQLACLNENLRRNNIEKIEN